VKRSPIRQKEGLAPLSIISFEISAAGLTVVNAKVFLSFNRQSKELMIVGAFAEWAPNSPISPARAATAAKEEPQAAGIGAN
jgi:hypothetical protein